MSSKSVPSIPQNNETGHIHRLTLFHYTSVENAEKIIKSQQFKLGDGLFSKGIYFANTLEAAYLKTFHHRLKNKNIKWTLLVADVYVGKYISYKKDEIVNGHKIDSNDLRSRGFDSVIGYGLKSGKEVISLKDTMIHNIKYAYGVKPTTFTPINRDRITLFKFLKVY